jgi:hypothetical protein
VDCLLSRLEFQWDHLRGQSRTAGNRRKEMADYLHYAVSVVDSDGDNVLDDAPMQATTLQSAWEQAIVIAFRVCRGSGALPMTITVTQAKPYQQPSALE